MREEFDWSGNNRAIRGYYDDIFSLKSGYEAALARIGIKTYDHIMRAAIGAGLADKSKRRSSEREIASAMKLMEGRQPGSPIGPGMYLSDIGLELSKNNHNALICKQCIELPRLFRLLYIHRNKKAHNHKVTAADLYLLYGCIFVILDLTREHWKDDEVAASLWRTIEEKLARANEDNVNENEQLKIELTQKNMELEKARDQINRLRLDDSKAAIDDKMRRLDESLSAIVKKIDDVASDQEQQIERLHESFISLKNEISSDDQSMSEEDQDTEDDSDIVDADLSKEMIVERFRQAARRIEELLPGTNYKANIFQTWIVNEALEAAAAGRLKSIEEWWQLPMVAQKKELYEMEMKRQLSLGDGKCAEWMMDVYRRLKML